VIVYGLGFVRGLLAILAGNLVLALYVGLLSHLAGSTGRNFALVAKSTFGNRGYAIASGFLSTIVIGWFAFQTGLTGSTLHSTLGWNEPATILLAGVLYIAVTFVGIRALAILGAVAARCSWCWPRWRSGSSRPATGSARCWDTPGSPEPWWPASARR